jgi:hypothetical protein
MVSVWEEMSRADWTENRKGRRKRKERQLSM